MDLCNESRYTAEYNSHGQTSYNTGINFARLIYANMRLTHNTIWKNDALSGVVEI